MVVAATEAVARVAVGAAAEEMAVGEKVEVTVVVAMVEGESGRESGVCGGFCVWRGWQAPGLRATPSAPRPPRHALRKAASARGTSPTQASACRAQVLAEISCAKVDPKVDLSKACLLMG